MAAEQVYFDHAATTAPRPEVVEAMLPFLQDKWGNPSSLHQTGVAALEGVERARAHVGALVGAQPEEIVFCGSGTEADNHALVGVWVANRHRKPHFITSSIEHHAVLHTAAFLEELGVRVTYLPVDGLGLVDPEAVRDAITPETVLVSIMHANNEVGTLQPVAEIGAICRERDVLFHTDAVQTVGHLPLDVNELNVDLLSLSAHKLYGPKGVGALYQRAGTKLPPFVRGGKQELGRRASTENVAGIVGLGEAARLARVDMSSEIPHVTALRDAVLHQLRSFFPEVRTTGHPTQRLPNNASFCIPGVEGEALVLELDAHGFAVSSGSACTSGALTPSHVLVAMGIEPEVARGSVRLSFGRGNTMAQVERLLAVMPAVVERLRMLSPIEAR
ncbi:MAG: cysteine desulfurase family protein [Armatimonadota bacterium]